MKHCLIAVLCLCFAIPSFAQDKEDQRLQESYTVLKEILATPDKGIPRDLLDKAECVVVFPSVKKAAFVVGASYGRGVITCRSGQDLRGSWSAPAMFALEGGSVGFQIGGQATDFVLLIMNESGANSVMSSKVKLGGDASAAIGPKGRDAEAATDVTMHTEILTYSRSRGLFAGVSLEGSTLRQDNGANEKIYGRKVTARDIVRNHVVGTNSAGQVMVSALQKASPRNLSDPKSLRPEAPESRKKK